MMALAALMDTEGTTPRDVPARYAIVIVYAAMDNLSPPQNSLLPCEWLLVSSLMGFDAKAYHRCMTMVTAVLARFGSGR